MTAFTRTMVPANGMRQRGAIITCGHCGRIETVPVNTFKGSKNDINEHEDRFIARKLESSGWLVGKRDNQNRCPGCYSAIKMASKRKAEALKMSNEPKPLTIVRDNSSLTQMSREDRRVIFEKLNEVYLDEKKGYSADWTDAKVASDLGIARAWVSKVREEMFGPEAANDDIRKALSEAKAALAECRKLAETFTPLLVRAEKIEKTLVEIERSLH